MWFVRRFFLSSLVFAAFAAPGHAVTPGWNSITWIAAMPVRELNPAWTGAGSCILAAALILRHSARFRK
jgi:hypothetical protein